MISWFIQICFYFVFVGIILCCNVQAILLISVLIACATAPINMVIDFLFEDIISAPLADEYKVELQSRQLRQRMGRRLSQVGATARGAIRNSISVARNAISPVTASAPSKLERSFSGRVKESVLERFTVPDATTRKLPPSVVQSYASTSMMLKDVFDQHKAKSFHRSLKNTPAYMLHGTDTDRDTAHARDQQDEASLYDSAERGEMVENKATSFRSFYAMLSAQCEHLHGAERIEFQERWGFDSDADIFQNELNLHGGSNQHVVSSGVSAKLRLQLCCQSRRTSRKRVLSKAIEDATQATNEKIHKLKIASDMQVGLEIMHLFIIDLLG